MIPQDKLDERYEQRRREALGPTKEEVIQHFRPLLTLTSLEVCDGPTEYVCRNGQRFRVLYTVSDPSDDGFAWAYVREVSHD